MQTSTYPMPEKPMDWSQVTGAIAAIGGLLGVGTGIGSWIARRDARLLKAAADERTVQGVPKLQTDFDSFRNESREQNRQIMEALNGMISKSSKIEAQIVKDQNYRHNLGSFLTIIVDDLNTIRAEKKIALIVVPDLHRDPLAPRDMDDLHQH